MERPTHVVLRRKKPTEEGVMSVYNDSEWEVPEGYPPRPPHHDGPRPPMPDHWKPRPVDPDNLKIGMGLQLENNVVSVKVDDRGDSGLKVTPHGLSIDGAMRKIASQDRKINELTAVIVDLKSQINKLKLATTPQMIAKSLAATYGLFEMDGNRLILNLGGGLIVDEYGMVSINAGTGLKFENDGEKLSIDPDATITVNEDNEFGVNVDNDTIQLNEDGKLSASADTSWKEYKTN